MIRLSGKDALSILQKVYVPRQKITHFKPRFAYFGDIVERGVRLDNVLIIYFKAPHSFTGEDTVEIFCHGGAYLSARILDLVIEQGATAARAGEFTERAFLNGKLDLLQAEGIEDLIMADSENAIRLANDLLSGQLTQWVEGIKDKIIDLACGLEAEIEFPDEGDVSERIHEVQTKRLSVLTDLIHTLQRCVDTFSQGLVLREGISMVLVGAPNVGKSTLMNQLLGYQRALVSDVPGTTRDYLREKFYIKGIPIHLVDLAGIRENPDEIEHHGIQKAGEWIARAELCIFITDASRSINSDDFKALENLKPDIPTLWVKNKTDLPPVNDNQTDPRLLNKNWIPLCAQNGAGTEQLIREIEHMLQKKIDVRSDDLFITHTRHKNAITKCLEHLHIVHEGVLELRGEEILSFELREGLKSLELLTGEITSDDVMNSIFSRFCIGK